MLAILSTMETAMGISVQKVGALVLGPLSFACGFAGNFEDSALLRSSVQVLIITQSDARHLQLPSRPKNKLQQPSTLCRRNERNGRFSVTSKPADISYGQTAALRWQDVLYLEPRRCTGCHRSKVASPLQRGAHASMGERHRSPLRMSAQNHPLKDK